MIHKLDQFVAWMQSYDFHGLQNEDDVETKFVIPFFQHLGYPDANRRGKYALKTYNPGKAGRKPEIDQIFFSTDNPEEHNADTSLVIVEAKEPQEVDLGNALAQARFYGEHLTPSFLVVTNGHQLKVLKRHRYRGDEVVFDDTVDNLKQQSMLTAFYKQLNFDIVTHVKENVVNKLTHAQYAQLEQSLRHYPDLQTILDQGDFSPSITREGQRLTVVKPKVAIICDLPLGFGEGQCQIEFSNVTRRGLTIHVSHQNILGQLMPGLQTDPKWNTRLFVHHTENQAFEVQLGQTTTILSKAEVYDLCACVDTICQEYKQIITDAEDLLETWPYEPVQVEDVKGFYVLSMERWLWDLIKEFSREFDGRKGRSDWHIFEWNYTTIRIRRAYPDNVLLWPKPDDAFLPSENVEVLYQVPGWLLQSLTKKDGTWKDHVGPRGLWTAQYTKNWLLDIFIPKVLSFYGREGYISQLSNLVSDRQSIGTSILKIDHPKQLARYLHAVQSWFHVGWSRNISAYLLRPYYQAFASLARGANRSSVDTDYIAGNLWSIRSWLDDHKDFEELDRNRSYQAILHELNQHVERISLAEYESFREADLMSRIFIAIVETGSLTFSQEQLNAATQALLPLVRESQFEKRYVLPNM